MYVWTLQNIESGEELFGDYISSIHSGSACQAGEISETKK